ncbi:Ybey/upf0054 family metalloprotein, partial [Globisporangium splendens]
MDRRRALSPLAAVRVTVAARVTTRLSAATATRAAVCAFSQQQRGECHRDSRGQAPTTYRPPLNFSLELAPALSTRALHEAHPVTPARRSDASRLVTAHAASGSEGSRAQTFLVVAKAFAAQLRNYPTLSVRVLDAQVKAMVRSIQCPGGPWDVGVMLTSDKHIQQLNRKYRDKDKPTDILSFPFHKITKPGRFPRVSSREERYLGDIYISPAYVQQQCVNGELDEDTTLEQRMPILLAHGICHLMGYDHEKDDDFERMQKAEAYILKRYTQYLPPAYTNSNTNKGEHTTE